MVGVRSAGAGVHTRDQAQHAGEGSSYRHHGGHHHDDAHERCRSRWSTRTLPRCPHRRRWLRSHRPERQCAPLRQYRSAGGEHQHQSPSHGDVNAACNNTRNGDSPTNVIAAGRQTPYCRPAAASGAVDNKVGEPDQPRYAAFNWQFPHCSLPVFRFAVTVTLCPTLRSQTRIPSSSVPRRCR